MIAVPYAKATMLSAAIIFEFAYELKEEAVANKA